MKKNYPILINDTNSNYDYYYEVQRLVSEASDYLINFKWCDKINDIHLYYNLGKIICIFLFDIDNSQGADPDDDKIWIIAGDLPIMYLDSYGSKSIKEVLENYTELSEDWANNILNKKSLAKCFPFKEKPSKELAKMLKSRIDFIRNELMPNIKDIRLSSASL